MRWLDRFSALVRREPRHGPESQIRRRVRAGGEVVIRDAVVLADERLEALRAREILYSEQRRALEDGADWTDTDVFVADYAVAMRRYAAPFSYSVWTRGVVTLLPETEFVVLSAVATDADDYWEALVPWSELQRLTDGTCLLREPDLVPARWRAVTWPEAPALQRLRAAAVRL